MSGQVVKGKVLHKDGKYLLEVAGKMEELPAGLLADEESLKNLAGQEVEVFYTAPKSFVAAIKPIKGKGIMTCNMPAEILRGQTFITNPTPAMVDKVATKLLDEGLITREMFNKIRQGGD